MLQHQYLYLVSGVHSLLATWVGPSVKGTQGQEAPFIDGRMAGAVSATGRVRGKLHVSGKIQSKSARMKKPIPQAPKARLKNQKRRRLINTEIAAIAMAT